MSKNGTGGRRGPLHQAASGQEEWLSLWQEYRAATDEFVKAAIHLDTVRVASGHKGLRAVEVLPAALRGAEAALQMADNRQRLLQTEIVTRSAGGIAGIAVKLAFWEHVEAPHDNERTPSEAAALHAFRDVSHLLDIPLSYWEITGVM